MPPKTFRLWYYVSTTRFVEAFQPNEERLPENLRFASLLRSQQS